MKMVLYKDHVKVDFKLYQTSEFITEIKKEKLPDDWDVGYKILLDKDGLTRDLKPPTYQSVMIHQPSEKKFKQLLNDFWWDTTYVAKCLKRGDIFYAKFMSENILRTDYLVPLIEWYIAADHDWNTITTNKHGRLFQKYLSDDLWNRIKLPFPEVILMRTGLLYWLMLIWYMNWVQHWQKNSTLNIPIPLKKTSGIILKK
jgi:aminoglycoside 6-adenylyltransferase